MWKHVVYSYLTTDKLVNDIRRLSRLTRDQLVDSHVSSEGKVFTITFTNNSTCLLCDNILYQMLWNKRVILDLVESVNLDLGKVSACLSRPRGALCQHKLEERISKLVNELPNKFVLKKISVIGPSVPY